ncbi:MAG: endopeptidase La [Bdellovibrio sp.]|nr:endopeptidase La [Bdellovibrio sp.]
MQNGTEKSLPLIAVQNTMVFPLTSLFLVIGRKMSVRALEAAQSDGGRVIVAAQIPIGKDLAEIDPTKIFTFGTLCELRSIHGNEKTGFQVLVSGRVRFKINRITEKENYLEATGEEDPDECVLDAESAALSNNIKIFTRQLLELRPGTDKTISGVIEESNKCDEIVYHSASYLNLDVVQMHELLSEASIKQKMKKILEWIGREREVFLLEKDIREKVGKRLNTAQREGLLREQLQAIKEELGESKSNKQADLSERIKKAQMPKEVEKVAMQEYDRLSSMHYSSPEFQVIENYLDWLCALPWNVSTEDIFDLKQSEIILEKQHYGLPKIKRRILEHLAVAKLTGNQKGPILCLVGPPGVGKTSLGRSIADAMGRKFIRVSLGGVRDTSDIRGHRRTYIGSMPGRIIQNIKRAGVNNPVMLLDEIDKLGSSFMGDPSSAMLEVLDPEQNNTFVDNFLDVSFDLSQIFFITTANRLDTIPEPLRDRMEIIELSSYTLNEKIHIGEKFILPMARIDAGLSLTDVSLSSDLLGFVIEGYTREAGVRELKRVLSSVCRAWAFRKLKDVDKTLFIDKKMLEEFLGPPKFLRSQRLRNWVPGLATGLAWTPVGGDVLFLESLKAAGKGELKLTGQLGDVMKESAEIGLSYICSRLNHLDPDFSCQKFDIHLHIPAGAIPKDGPSAGITIATCLASLIINKEVDQDLAMTGELTLSGSVLPVGGIKEKVLAAHRYKIKRVILPKGNEKDLYEVPEEIRKEMEFISVDSMDEVLELTLNMTQAMAALWSSTPQAEILTS